MQNPFKNEAFQHVNSDSHFVMDSVRLRFPIRHLFLAKAPRSPHFFSYVYCLDFKAVPVHDTSNNAFIVPYVQSWTYKIVSVVFGVP